MGSRSPYIPRQFLDRWASSGHDVRAHTLFEAANARNFPVLVLAGAWLAFFFFAYFLVLLPTFN